MNYDRIQELRASLRAEAISYGELAEIEAAFDEIPDSELPEARANAMASDMLDELEARTDRAHCPDCGIPTIPDREDLTADDMRCDACQTLLDLCNELRDYCNAHGLPQMSADELALEIAGTNDHGNPHVRWLSDFSDRWDAMVDQYHVRTRG